jgi:predicted permease
MAVTSPDLRGAIRGLRRSRSVVLLAVTCLALGVGSSAAMLGLLDVLLLRPPAHVAQAGFLRRLYISDTLPGVGAFTASETSYPIFQDLAKVRSFSALGAYFSSEVSIGRGAEATKARAALVTPSFLRMLGVKPVVGRLFLGSEGQPGSQSFVTLLGYDLWRRGFGGSLDVLGRQIVVGNDIYAIAGVLPSRFTGVDLEPVDLWLPMDAADRFIGHKWATGRGNRFLEIVGRLKPSVAPEAAVQEATTVFRSGALEAGRPKPAARVLLAPVQRGNGPEAPAAVRVTAWLSGISGVVLLISCANVASLLLLRALDRRRELGLQLALGASSGHLARMMLVESALLGTLGGGAALLVYLLMSALLRRVILPEAASTVTALNLRTLGIVAVLAALATLISGLTPALWVRRRNLMSSIRAGTRESGPQRAILSGGLAAGQIALTLVLLSATGSFAYSLYNVLHLDLGMDAERVLVATVDLKGMSYPPTRIAEIFRLAVERVRRLPGVERASLAATIPFETSRTVLLSVPGVASLPELETGGPYINGVSEDFFATAGTPVLRGRPFTAEDRAGALPVAIVNATMARLLWPERDALGQCLRIGGDQEPCATVVGVVKDARRSELQEGPTMQYYVPLEQAKKLTSRALFVRVAGNPKPLLGLVRQELQASAPDLPFVEVRPLDALLGSQTHPWRMGVAVLGIFGLLAMSLALVGLYGVVAHSMAQRRYELGVRVALGASWRNVLWLALRQGLLIGLSGAVAGLLLTAGVARLLQPLLFQVSALDPRVLALATATVLLLALLASYAPSRGLRRLEPVATLRVE